MTAHTHRSTQQLLRHPPHCVGGRHWRFLKGGGSQLIIRKPLPEGQTPPFWNPPKVLTHLEVYLSCIRFRGRHHAEEVGDVEPRPRGAQALQFRRNNNLSQQQKAQTSLAYTVHLSSGRRVFTKKCKLGGACLLAPVGQLISRSQCCRPSVCSRTQYSVLSTQLSQSQLEGSCNCCRWQAPPASRMSGSFWV